MNKLLWKNIFKQFRQTYPELWVHGTSFQPYGYLVIKIWIPTKGIILYNYQTEDITWLEHWVDEKAIKLTEDEMRPEMYDTFCFVVERYMKDRHLTQQQFADKVGISRMSLNAYLNGRKIPKVNTMRRICEAIHINIG